MRSSSALRNARLKPWGSGRGRGKPFPKASTPRPAKHQRLSLLLPCPFWLLLFLHCFPTSFITDFLSLSAPKIDPKLFYILQTNNHPCKFCFVFVFASFWILFLSHNQTLEPSKSLNTNGVCSFSCIQPCPSYAKVSIIRFCFYTCCLIKNC